MPSNIFYATKTIDLTEPVEDDGSLSSRDSSTKTVRSIQSIRSVRRKASNIYQSIKKSSKLRAPSVSTRPGREGIVANYTYTSPHTNFLQTVLSDGDLSSSALDGNANPDDVDSNCSSIANMGRNGSGEGSLSRSEEENLNYKYLQSTIVDSKNMAAPFVICNCTKCKISPFSVRPRLLQGEQPK